MSEVPATVESEFVPEPKPYSDRIIQWMSRTENEEAYIHRDEIEGMCKRQGGRYRILRVSPPVERRVEDTEATDLVRRMLAFIEGLNIPNKITQDEFDTAIAIMDEANDFIQRHARIVEGPKQ